MLIDAIFTLFIGILAGLGVGSGGLLILYMTAIDGIDQLTAQGLNLAVFAFALGAAVIVHLHRREISLPILGFVAVFGALGACCGSILAQVTPTEGLRLALGGLLLVMGLVAFFRK